MDMNPLIANEIPENLPLATYVIFQQRDESRGRIAGRKTTMMNQSKRQGLTEPTTFTVFSIILQRLSVLIEKNLDSLSSAFDLRFFKAIPANPRLQQGKD